MPASTRRRFCQSTSKRELKAARPGERAADHFARFFARRPSERDEDRRDADSACAHADLRIEHLQPRRELFLDERRLALVVALELA